MTIYEKIMNHPESKKAALIKFGFGQLSPFKLKNGLSHIIRPNTTNLEEQLTAIRLLTYILK
ncbi:hypothetical protein P4T89_12440 [Bacillus nakamurai]|uniref:hypothetical protein n=1 Tax=Bacillus nakamurai TaxID=1793963 RepID=UPI001E368EF0|nr:hypothetical protein [Bacillus nakamurai]MED1228329.1 hypothetical protein [Bacillus nakamurai]